MPTGGQDLFMLLKGWPASRIQVEAQEGLDTLHDHFAAYAASCLVIDRYFGHRAPSWLREGIATETQRAQLQDVRVTTIAYELRDPQAGGDWLRELSRLLSGQVKGLTPLTARQALTGDLEAVPFSTYRQYCGMFLFLRDWSRALEAKDHRNRLAEVIRAVHDGVTSDQAVATIFLAQEPKLTEMWRIWADAAAKGKIPKRR
jgi:hypothetical protein